ncbi:N-acetyltransferase [Herbaspirillum rubrisubalbicans]|uniref:N-acetyltransferase n=2 Tax=Herbaspirillum rubrisubalbicans TaxID=80842 RepID=A0AAD0U771_9BURK|nr:N-acetyltransferase [Herbaspirillum rubrisubalbicans]
MPNWAFNADANTGHGFAIFMASVGPLRLRLRLTLALGLIDKMTAMQSPLRHPNSNDAHALVRLFTDPHIRRYLGGPRSQTQAHASALDLVSATRRYPAWVVVKPGSSNPVGIVSLSLHHDNEDVEVSFVLFSEVQGLGLGKAAVAAALREAWALGLQRVIAETQSANVRSIRLLQKLGFTPLREIVRFSAKQTILSIQRPEADVA